MVEAGSGGRFECGVEVRFSMRIHLPSIIEHGEEAGPVVGGELQVGGAVAEEGGGSVPRWGSLVGGVSGVGWHGEAPSHHRLPEEVAGSASEGAAGGDDVEEASELLGRRFDPAGVMVGHGFISIASLLPVAC